MLTPSTVVLFPPSDQSRGDFFFYCHRENQIHGPELKLPARGTPLLAGALCGSLGVPLHSASPSLLALVPAEVGV